MTHGLSQKLRERHFTHFGVEEGLASAFCYATCQGYRGYMWVGTAHGLYLHDGARMRLFRHHSDTSDVLRAYPIKALFEDSHKNLWVGTQGAGVIVLDSTRRISHRYTAQDSIAPITHNEILCFGEDHLGNIWIGTEQGANFLSAQDHQIIQVKPQVSGLPWQKNAILSFLEDSQQRIWLGTWGAGIFRTITPIQSAQNEFDFQQFRKGSSKPSIPENNVFQMVQDDIGRIWIACYRGGLVLMPEPEEDLFLTIPFDAQTQHGLSSSEPFTVHLGQHERLWVGTGNGLNISMIIPKTRNPDSLIQALSSRWEHFYKSFELEFGPTANDIRSIIEDRSGNTWLATENGISLHKPLDNLFSNHTFVEEFIRTQNFTAILERPDRSVWLGISDQLYLYFPDNQVLRKIKTGITGTIRAVYEDLEGNLMIGTTEGLYFRSYNGAVSLIPQTGSVAVTSIQLGPDDSYWVSGRKGFYQVTGDPRSGYSAISISSLNSKVIHDFVWESSEVCWLASENSGLIRFHKSSSQTDSFLPYPEDPKAFINQNFFSICLDDQDIWLGTSQGVFRFHIPNQGFSHKGSEAGLRTPTILSVQKDPTGRIWVLSNPGVAVWSDSRQQFQYLDINKGLNNEEFEKHMMTTSQTGDWILAGNKSVSYFNPLSFQEDDRDKVITFTSFSLKWRRSNDRPGP